MNTNEKPASTKQNDDILKSLRHLNSCITLTSVKEGNSESRSPSPSDSGSSAEEDNQEDSRIPSALRGISIQGASGKGILSNLLAKSISESPQKNDTKTTSISASSNVTSISSSLSALRGVSFTSKGNDSIKDLIEKAREQNKESASQGNTSSLAAFGLRGVTIQGASVTARNSKSDKDSDDSDSSDKGPVGKTSKALPSFPGVSIQGITATKVPSKQPEEDNDDSSNSSAPSSPGIPSALRGISIKGSDKDSLLSSLLGKSKEKDDNKKWINEWSKRCVSISFSTQNKDSDEEDQHVEGKGSPENGSPYSTANSASNSRGSLTRKKEERNSAEPENKGELFENSKLPISEPAVSSVEKKISSGPELVATSNSSLQEKEINNKQVSHDNEISLAKITEKEASSIPEKELFNLQETPELHCLTCSQNFSSRTELLNHLQNCPKYQKPSTSLTVTGPKRLAVARKNSKAIHKFSSLPERNRKRRECIHCGIFNFRSYLAFEEHHAEHIRNYRLAVYLKRCKEQEEGVDSDHSSGNSSSIGVAAKGGPEDRSLKLKFKISDKRGKGNKKRVEIINNLAMNEGSLSPSTERQNESSPHSGVQREVQDSGVGVDEGIISESSQLGQQNISQSESRRSSSDIDFDESTPSSQESSFSGFENNLSYSAADAANERPPSTYQPQFESFPGDWFNEYESGSRIAAAMTGSSADEAAQSGSNSYSTVSEGSNSEASYNQIVSKDPNSSSNGDGLFSQAVLGAEGTQAGDDQRQGSFEQLCLNDSYVHSQSEANLPQPPPYQESQQYHPQVQSGSDLLSELAYLNNSSHQPMDAVRTSPHDTEQTYNSHHSNSGTPTSAGHPTPPPTDTSFRALATSPLNSSTSPNLNSGGPTPPMQGSTPPVQSSTSPLQQMSQMGSMSENISAPRLTIANNLMATTANNSIPQINAYGQQWATPTNSQHQNFPPNYMQPQMAGTMVGNMGNVRPPTYANMPVSYRPSPPARIRGRPPLLGHVARPPIRGPGRPPGSILPNLMPGGGRGGMIPNLRPQFGGNRGGMVGGQKRTQPQAGQSPNKSLRREDINVPSRQKDNECQIIAVANRADGLPVIANVQGREERSKSTSALTSDSTIHLSDSITLSVRPNQPTGREAGRGEKGGDAGVVANLLASRGITVTPAAGEKESTNSREERRLPSASDLNLSSAISVHPPTSRDRDGFAVPHPPSIAARASGGGIINTQVDRPTRPPTVDLTQDISASGSPATRLQCSQCERTFPSQALLADHAKVHQQQTQSRMPHKCHLCTAGFSTQKGQQHHYQNFHQLHLSAGDLAIPVVDFRNPVNVQRMARLGIRSFLPLSNLQNRGSGGIVGIPILSVENLQNGQVNMQQWGITDILTLGPPKTLNPPR